MRGVYQAEYLTTLAERATGRHDVDVGKAFELIVGTSTGAIVATALAAGKRLERVRDLYVEHGPRIFPFQWARSVWGIGAIVRIFGLGLERGDKALRNVLTDVMGSETLGQMYARRGIALAIPATVLNRHAALVFKTKHMERLNGRDDPRTLVDVCMASTAAPILRSMATLREKGLTGGGPNVSYVDGGLWANNPGLVGMVDAAELLAERNERRPIEIYMLGSFPPPAGEQIDAGKQHRSAFGWQFGIKAISLSLDAQAIGYDYLAKKMAELRNDGSSAVRLPTAPPAGRLLKALRNMDDARPKILNDLAAQAISDADLAWSRTTGMDGDFRVRALCDALKTAPSYATEIS